MRGSRLEQYLHQQHNEKRRNSLVGALRRSLSRITGEEMRRDHSNFKRISQSHRSSLEGMSIRMINLAVEIVDLTPGQKCVLLLLANRANNNDQAWPTVDDLARQACMTDRGVRLCIGALHDRGLISKTLRNNKSNLYQLTIDGNPVENVDELSSPPADEQGGTQFRSGLNSVPIGPELSSYRAGTQFRQTQKNHQLTIIEPKEDGLDNLNVEAWHEYIAYRKEAGFPNLKPVSEQKQKRRMAQFSNEVQAEAINQTIANGWRGLFPQKIERQGKRPTYAEQIAADLNASSTEEGKGFAALE